MINIHGIKMTFYPYLNMLDKTMLENITEWSPTDINNLTHLPFYVLSLIILGILLFSKKKIQLLDTRSAKEREEIGYIDGSILIDTSLSDISNEILQLDRDVGYLLY